MAYSMDRLHSEFPDRGFTEVKQDLELAMEESKSTGWSLPDKFQLTTLYIP